MARKISYVVNASYRGGIDRDLDHLIRAAAGHRRPYSVDLSGRGVRSFSWVFANREDAFKVRRAVEDVDDRVRTSWYPGRDHATGVMENPIGLGLGYLVGVGVVGLGAALYETFKK